MSSSNSALRLRLLRQNKCGLEHQTSTFSYLAIWTPYLNCCSKPRSQSHNLRNQHHYQGHVGRQLGRAPTYSKANELRHSCNNTDQKLITKCSSTISSINPQMGLNNKFELKTNEDDDVGLQILPTLSMEHPIVQLITIEIRIMTSLHRACECCLSILSNRAHTCAHNTSRWGWTHRGSVPSTAASKVSSELSPASEAATKG